MGFDLSVILERLGGDREILQEIAQLFIEDAPDSMAQIRQAIDDRDAGAMEKAAHSLKGSVSNFGVEEAVQAALQLEMMGRDGNLSDAEATFSTLKAEVDKLRDALAEVC